ncbi:MAG: ABC transporter substrate-binding protein [Candidatus Dormibacteraceae bacterium]
MPQPDAVSHLTRLFTEGRLTRRQLIQRLALLGVGLPAASAILAACGSSGSGTGGGQSTSSRIAIGMDQEPTSTDIVGDPTAAIGNIFRDNVFEGLVRLNSEGTIVPQLAKSWDISSDNTQYTFHLVQGVKWHDGSPFTSADVKYSWQRAMDPSTKPPNPYGAYWASVDTISAPDPHTVQVKLKQYSWNFLFHMTASSAVIVQQKNIPQIASKPIGTGPYKFDSWIHGSSLSLTRNDAYWGTRGKLKTVAFNFITEANSMGNALTAGQIAIIAQVTDPSSITTFQSNPSYVVQQGAPTGKIIVAMNNTSPKLSDVRVRQAISAAIDRSAWIKGVASGYAVPIGSHACPNKGEPYYIDLTKDNPYDLQKAKQLLAAAGQPNLTIGLAVPTDLWYASPGAQILVSALQQIGVTAQVQDMQFAQWLAQVFGGSQSYDLTIIDHVEERDIFNYGNPKYYWHYNNPQVATWLDQADATPQAGPRKALYANVQRTLAEQAANGFVMSLKTLAVLQKSVKGFGVSAISPSIYMPGVYTT